jgi:glycosyl transferase family 25
MSHPADHRQPRFYIHPVNARLSTYLINLDRAGDRRKRMSWLLARHGLVFERVQAVDGNDIQLPSPFFDERGYLERHGRRPNRAEIGCYLSHVECARRLLESSFEHALILEDDLDFDEELLDTLSAALDQAGSWDLLRLSSVNSGHKFPVLQLSGKHSLALALTREKGSGAYVINRRAAEWIVTALLPMRLPYDLAFDLEHEAGLKGCFITPEPVSQSAERMSYIQTRLSDYKLKHRRPASVMLHRARMESGRFIARLARLMLWRIFSAFR